MLDSELRTRILNWLLGRWDSHQQSEAGTVLYPRYPLIPLLAVLTVLSGGAGADVFLLHSGGQVEGEWTNREQSRTAGSEVRTATGIRVRVAAGQVEQRVPQLKGEAEYERVAPTYGPSVEDQWRLAEWCRVNSLPHHRQAHLKAILALDSNHVAARRALGYRQYGNQWQTLEERKRSAGYELYRGRWRLTQDVEVQEEKAKRDLAEAEWLVKLRRWRDELATDHAPKAYQQLEEVRDPSAVPAVRKLIAKEPHRKVKLLYLDVLQRIGDGSAVQCLVQTALNDPDHEIFLETADRLDKMPPQRIAKPLMDTLRDANNVRVNRAAYMIGKTGDKKLVAPLVEALITLHRTTIVPNGGDSTSFGSDGSVGISRGNDPKVVEVPVQNRAVLEALVGLTGQDFDYDQRAWRRWYDLERGRIFAEAGNVDLRRENAPNQTP